MMVFSQSECVFVVEAEFLEVISKPKTILEAEAFSRVFSFLVKEKLAIFSSLPVVLLAVQQQSLPLTRKFFSQGIFLPRQVIFSLLIATNV